ncbi:MAG: bifunctional DNA-formamidopyrimidine glycosylase/DNA-(apurinic or apyrimidinic site) lyase [Planctomycetia bacterium]|jgi:formamidopyrimidine-DNA glycosylase
MPELPEVETMRRGIAAVVGLRIAAAEFPRGTRRPIAVRPAPEVLARTLAGRRIAATARFGKRVGLELAPGGGEPRQWLLIEPRMTGLMLVAPPPTSDHVRLIVSLASRRVPRLLFWDRRGLGTVRLVDERGLEAACGRERLGPDGLFVTGSELAARLGRSRRAIKVALLDQKAVAGIGNIYAAEILFHAGIDPRTACRRLKAESWERIAATARRVLASAVRLEGSTIGDATYRTADNRSGRFQHRHRVYGREGKPCRRCGGTVERLVQGQRSTFFCPGCQWHPRRRSRTI